MTDDDTGGTAAELRAEALVAVSATVPGDALVGVGVPLAVAVAAALGSGPRGVTDGNEATAGVLTGALVASGAVVSRGNRIGVFCTVDDDGPGTIVGATVPAGLGSSVAVTGASATVVVTVGD